MIGERPYQVWEFMEPEEAEVIHRRRVDFLARRQGRLAEEAGRLAGMIEASSPPDSMGAAPIAPARGAMLIEDEMGILPGVDVTARRGDAPRLRHHGRFWREADPLSIQCRQAARRHEESGSEAPFVPPYSPGQISIALHYRAITERHDAGGVRCSSLEAGREGGGGGDFMDAHLSLGRELSRMHAAIGGGSAMAVRRIRPSARGSRVSIPDRRIVDMVCLGGSTLTQVLEAHGWVAKGETRFAIRAALCAALDRMRG